MTIKLTNYFSTQVSKNNPRYATAIKPFSWYAKRNGNHWYAARRGVGRKGKTIWMHRELLNAQPNDKCDHKDGEGLNNLDKNIRLCSPRENQRAFRKKRSGVTSEYRGVSFHRSRLKWRATIKTAEKYIHLGYFNTPYDAAKSYDAAAVKFFGEFASLNFIRRANKI